MNIFKKLIYKYNKWVIKRILKKTALTVNPAFHVRNVMGNMYNRYLFDYSELNESEKAIINSPYMRGVYTWVRKNRDNK